MSKRRYWLFKSEPDVYSIDDLAAEPGQTAIWEGVRNYQARNMLRDEIQKGDGVLFYHSRAKELGVAGTCRIVKAGYPDPVQFDPKEKYYDPKSDPDEPRWIAVDVNLDRRFDRIVLMAELRAEPELSEMKVIAKGQRLSIQPVTPEEWKKVLQLSRRKNPRL